MPTQRQVHSLANILLSFVILGETSLPALGQVRGRNYIHNIIGKVLVMRFLSYWQASDGDRLTSKVKLKVHPNSQVTLICSNHTRYVLMVGKHVVSSYCPAKTVRKPGGRNHSRAPFNTSLPYIVSPTNTTLLKAKDLEIEWNPSPGATTYQVQISGPGVNWQTKVNQTRVIYPNPEEFKPDYRYTIQIVADNGLKSETGITQISTTEAKRVTKEQQQIMVLELEPNTKAIGLALFYKNYIHSDPERQSYALNNQAIQVLKRRVDEGTDNSQIYLLLADTYLDVKLPLKAQEYYHKALELSSKANQPTRQTESYLGLGRIAEGQSLYRDAIQYLKSAQELIQEDGDTEQIEELRIRIRRLEEEINKS